MVSEIWSYDGLKIVDFTQQTVTQYCLTRRYLQIYASLLKSKDHYAADSMFIYSYTAGLGKRDSIKSGVF